MRKIALSLAVLPLLLGISAFPSGGDDSGDPIQAYTRGSTSDCQKLTEPLVLRSVDWDSRIADGFLDVTYPISPWGAGCRFPIPESVLERHDLKQEDLSKMVLLYDGCFRDWYFGGPVDNRRTYLLEEPGGMEFGTSYEKDPPPPPLTAPFPDRLVVWIEENTHPRVFSSSSEESPPVEEVGPIPNEACARYRVLHLRDRRETPSPPVLLGYKLDEGNQTLPDWEMMRLCQEKQENTLASEVCLSVSVGLVGESFEEGRDSLFRSLKGAEVPWGLWESDLGKLDGEIPRQRIEEATGRASPLIINTRDNPVFASIAVSYRDIDDPSFRDDNSQSLVVFANSMHRFWVLPPMHPGYTWNHGRIEGALDTNADDFPDIVLMEWSRFEGYGAVAFLLDGENLFFLQAGGGYYCP